LESDEEGIEGWGRGLSRGVIVILRRLVFGVWWRRETGKNCTNLCGNFILDAND
jgi:hypothetical protein